jgi:predicted phosphodiesterase
MLCAVISDVHSNLEALTAVLEAIDRIEVDALYCLGDLVGYNANPVECVDAILPRTAAVVRGNHDKAVCGLLDLDWFSRAARQAALWTRDHIDGETLERLRGLPAGPREVEGVLLCHGAPFDEDAYLADTASIADAYRFMEAHHPRARICLHGHTHFPLVVEKQGAKGRPEVLHPREEEVVQLRPGATYLINPGSVGQPRDGIARASFGILDIINMAYRNVRTTYKVHETQRKVLQAGLPSELAYRLAEGR